MKKQSRSGRHASSHRPLSDTGASIGGVFLGTALSAGTIYDNRAWIGVLLSVALACVLIGSCVLALPTLAAICRSLPNHGRSVTGVMCLLALGILFSQARGWTLCIEVAGTSALFLAGCLDAVAQHKRDKIAGEATHRDNARS
jgi:hypothetical protein